MGLSDFIPRIYRPVVYQGRRRYRNYFEGWYCKMVDKAGGEIWSIIFGVSQSKDAHSFIQVIRGTTGETEYIRFEREAFNYARDRFYVSVDTNILTADYLELDLEGEQFNLKGRVEFRNTTPFPVYFRSPGIMGWYRYVPFMECYHGVVSMNHKLKGALKINNRNTEFTGGKGYMEKDWGRSMPTDWVWLQCNHFSDEARASLMISVARIPWIGSHFPGFLSFLLVDGKLYRFATYNRSAIKELELGSKQVRIVLENRSHRLTVEAKRKQSGALQAPVKGLMERKIMESLDAQITVKLETRAGATLFSSDGGHAGLEIVGDITQYIK